MSALTRAEEISTETKQDFISQFALVLEWEGLAYVLLLEMK